MQPCPSSPSQLASPLNGHCTHSSADILDLGLPRLADLCHSGPNGTIECAKAGTYCAGDSGSTNIIIHCNEVGDGGYAGNCNDNLAGVCDGVCQFAPCKQSSTESGGLYCLGLLAMFDILTPFKTLFARWMVQLPPTEPS